MVSCAYLIVVMGAGGCNQSTNVSQNSGPKMVLCGMVLCVIFDIKSAGCSLSKALEKYLNISWMHRVVLLSNIGVQSSMALTVHDF